MKSLILKDLYNIGHNAKSMLFILVLLAVAFLPTSGSAGYIVTCAVLCSMMVVTTFSFDEHSKWGRYAMIMPIARKGLVAGKFVVLAVFCAVGSLFGLAVGTVGELVIKKVPFMSDTIGQLPFLALAAWAIAFVMGSMAIPLVFRFGAEKGRMLLLVSFLVPSAIGAGIYRLLVLLGIAVTQRFVFVLVCCSPAIAFLWCFAMYQISCRIFAKQEF